MKHSDFKGGWTYSKPLEIQYKKEDSNISFTYEKATVSVSKKELLSNPNAQDIKDCCNVEDIKKVLAYHLQDEEFPFCIVKIWEEKIATLKSCTDFLQFCKKSKDLQEEMSWYQGKIEKNPKAKKACSDLTSLVQERQKKYIAEKKQEIRALFLPGKSLISEGDFKKHQQTITKQLEAELTKCKEILGSAHSYTQEIEKILNKVRAFVFLKGFYTSPTGTDSSFQTILCCSIGQSQWDARILKKGSSDDALVIDLGASDGRKFKITKEQLRQINLSEFSKKQKLRLDWKEKEDEGEKNIEGTIGKNEFVTSAFIVACYLQFVDL
jgi:hypothetical protein